MEKQLSIAEAKNRLTSIIHDAEAGVSLKITRHGKPVAVLLSISEYDRLKGQKGDFWRRLTQFREKLEQEPDEITGDDFGDLRDRTPGRKVGF